MKRTRTSSHESEEEETLSPKERRIELSVSQSASRAQTSTPPIVRPQPSAPLNRKRTFEQIQTTVLPSHEPVSAPPEIRPLLHPLALTTPVVTQSEAESLATLNAARVGVQLVTKNVAGKEVVQNLIIAGRPTSPFVGTMGDHVTAFGSHVVNLRVTTENKELKDVRSAIATQLNNLKSLPGWLLIDDAQRPARETEIDTLIRSLSQDPPGTNDSQVATLQRAAARYLELRELVPLSLLNTRSITADSGKTRGEATQLPALQTFRSTEINQAKTKKPDNKRLATAKDIALGLFDDDASAMLTFNQSTNQKDTVARLLPPGTKIDSLMQMTSADLMRAIASQHVQSLFPGETSEDQAAIAEAVVNQLQTAHNGRAQKDGQYWQDQIAANLRKIGSVRDALDQTLGWAKTAGNLSADTESVLRHAGLLSDGAPDPFRKLLESLYDQTPGTVQAAVNVTKTSGLTTKTRQRPIDNVKRFLESFETDIGLVTGNARKRSFPTGPLTDLTSALNDLEKTLPEAAPAADPTASAPAKKPKSYPTPTRTVAPRKLKNTTDITETEREYALAGFAKAGPPIPSEATFIEIARVQAVLKSLVTVIGNSFTVGIHLDNAQKIETINLAGRPPSPFVGTMGAHSTSWLVWVHAVQELMKGCTVEQAGNNLVKFAEGLMADAQGQEGLVALAQNAQRRVDAAWTSGSMDAWKKALANLQTTPWTVSSVQAYGQAALTFVNMLPRTTVAGKNTNGHAEATAWQEALAGYASRDANKKSQAMIGAGLFDEDPNSWVFPRHLGLMELALGARGAQAWQAWPTLPASV